MVESYEVRIVEDFAHRLFAGNEGKKLSSGLVRRVILASTDPRLPEVGRLQREFRQTTKRFFFYGWQIHRKYTVAELESAPLFKLFVTAVFEPAGEECGTTYDESTACTQCGAGATQLPPLMLDTRKIPKGRDIAATIAGEVVVARRLADRFEREGITGLVFGPVLSAGRIMVECYDWVQLSVLSTRAEIVSPTRIGIEPFDEDVNGECRCSRGDLAGLNLLSEVSISSGTRGDADVVSTKQFVGCRRGLLRPSRVVLISPKVRSVLVSSKAKGWRADVAHVVA
jgi:hypothetical protein